MALECSGDEIRTAHLDLVPLTSRFVQALVAADLSAASAEIGAKVGQWLASDPSHAVQLELAQQRAAAEGFSSIGRAIVLAAAGADRRVIGSIGFLGPPDDRGRMDVACRIHPAHRRRGYGGEALTALLAWATGRYGVTSFLVSIPSGGAASGPLAFEVATHGTESLGGLGEIAATLESEGGRR